MSELLVMAHDKPLTGNPERDRMTWRAGDVVDVHPDGWAWGDQELVNPLFRIIKLPGVSVVAAQVFLGPEVDEDPRNPSSTLRRRMNSLNLGHPALVAKALDILDDARTKATVEIEAKDLDDVRIMLAVTRKPPVIRVLGVL